MPWGEIEVLGNGLVYYCGPIDDDAMDRIAITYRSRKFVKLLITSDGGMFDKGISIGRFVRDNNIKVEVIDRCKSACALIAIGDPHFVGTVHFHAPYVATPERDQTIADGFMVARARSRMAEYVKEMGFPQVPITKTWYELKGK